jgi:hypothetical protein
VTSDSLAADGYTKSNLMRPVAAGSAAEERDYELWWKETRNAARIARFCIVPKVSTRSYSWGVVVLVDGTGVWAYTSRELSSVLAGTPDPDCAVSTALPEGRLTWRVSFFYK